MVEVGSADFDIVSVDHVAGSREATVTWNSSEGTSYTVEASNDMLTWKELDDDVAGAAGDTTSFTEDFDEAPSPPSRRSTAILPCPPESYLMKFPARIGVLLSLVVVSASNMDWARAVNYDEVKGTQIRVA